MRKSKIIISIIILLLSFQGAAQFNENDKKQIVIGKVDSLYSNTLQEQREIWIHIPEDFDNNKLYPVIYVLDASQNFYVLTGMLKQLLPWQIPNSIVVGIKNTDRTRDFTNTNVPFQRGQESKTSGGASNFLKFIDKELKPFINNKYPTENNNTIIGHSTAGLFVLYTFLHHENSFDNYLAIDPSLWWDKENLVKETQKLLNRGNRKEKSLYIAVANSIGKAIDTVKVRKDKTIPTEQIRANLKFHDILVKNNKDINFKWEYFDNEDHRSIVVPAQYNGLRSIFSWFPFPEMWRFNTPKKYSSKELTEPFLSHYKKLSIRMKREVKPEWELLNQIGFFMLDGHNLPKKALAYLELNASFYSNESKSFVALGNYFLSQKNKSKAIINYKKALEIDANQEAQAKLKELE
ncbi:alpha/beta hydrolase-fold protein [Lacinutrix sp. 5H-3-7-4]|uniref:alpha/beta hydrolase-fold protein n=1 Tax=Lacinutrix sp. (strain 5H-3-7-4) TaxID=983544 RepID=UPI00020A3384|nr:alpha/beta hydrolase-fold protein [Lacinutrix sp. 5H-3-7-4]AEH02557.1 esterase [Lacinutrix sp. 5H-3-7-4]